MCASGPYRRSGVEQASGLLCPANLPSWPRMCVCADSVRQAGSLPGRAQAGGLRYYLVALARCARRKGGSLVSHSRCGQGQSGRMAGIRAICDIPGVPHMPPDPVKALQRATGAIAGHSRPSPHSPFQPKQPCPPVCRSSSLQLPAAALLRYKPKPAGIGRVPQIGQDQRLNPLMSD